MLSQWVDSFTHTITTHKDFAKALLFFGLFENIPIEILFNSGLKTPKKSYLNAFWAEKTCTDVKRSKIKLKKKKFCKILFIYLRVFLFKFNIRIN